jgi:hypothetical protein
MAEVVAWIVGLAAVLFFGRVYAVLTGTRTMSPNQAGEIVGTLIGAVLVGVFVRWLFVKWRKRGRVISPWILVIATFVLLIGLSGQRIPGASGDALPIGTYLAIETTVCSGATHFGRGRAVLVGDRWAD